MLIHLHIRNFALIDSVDLDFRSGFTVLTGETGSGKSILLGALGLIMGDRADYSLIGPGGEKAVCEALFKIELPLFAEWFKKYDLDLVEETVLRREILSSGKSRAFINDTPVSLSILKELSGSLFHIHSQYNTIELKSPLYQLELLDGLAGIESDCFRFKCEFNAFQEDRKEWLDLKERYDSLLKKSDYDEFQREEISRLQPEKYDFEALEYELKTLSKSEELKELVHLLEREIHGEGLILDKLKKLESSFSKLRSIHPVISETETRLHSLLLELKDINSDVTRILENQESNPARVEEIVSILDNYYRILKKHNLQNQNELIEFYKDLENRNSGLLEMRERIDNDSVLLKKTEQELIQFANNLHSKRMLISSSCSKRILEVLALLKMNGTRIDFRLYKREELNQYGCTDVRLLFSANEGMEMVQIEQAASGGELSRVMLALQKVLSEKKVLPTILFDEIDTGVSGEVAEKMGTLLSSMGETSQLIAITHLPQVAAKGSVHLKVEKIIKNGRTQSAVRTLNEDERIDEIARLLSGESITQAAVENARALMN